MKKLKHSYKEILCPVLPFNFEGTVCKPSHFPEKDILHDNKTYWQTMRIDDEIYGIKMQ